MNVAKPAKPIEVSQGVAALWIALAINLVASVAHAAIHFSSQGRMWAMLQAAVVLLLAWFFLHRIAHGRNWARITYLILKTLSIGSVVNTTEMLWLTTPLYVAINWVALIITFYGAYLLFTYPSDRWFEAMSAKVALAQK